jgi:hypothetical protein
MTGICHRFRLPLLCTCMLHVNLLSSLKFHDNVSVHCNAVKHPALSNNTILLESEIMSCDVMRFHQNTFTSCYDRLFAAKAPVCKMRGT